MTSKKWIHAAQRATTPAARRKFTRKHKGLKIRDEISTCTACDLCQTRTNTVPINSDIPRPIAFVGGSPNVKDEKAQTPFSGQIGALLASMIESTGNSTTDAVFLNTIQCRPPHNRNPHLSEQIKCEPLFNKQLNFSGAWVVMLLGDSALQSFRTNATVPGNRGVPFWQEGRIFIPTYHPSYVKRHPNLRAQTEHDIGLGFKIVNGSEWWEPTLSKPLADTKEQKDITALLDAQGYVIMNLARIEDTIALVKDDTIKIPIKYSSLPRYTLQEMVRIGEIGRAHRITTPELNAIHLTKRLGGVVVR